MHDERARARSCHRTCHDERAVRARARAAAARADRVPRYCHTTTFRSLGAAEVAADFTFCHKISDQDCLEILNLVRSSAKRRRRVSYIT